MCEFTPDPNNPDESTAETSWHYRRDCPHCGHQWWSLHCVHEGARPCPNCGKRIVPPPEVVSDDLGETDYASEDGRALFLALSWYPLRVARGAASGELARVRPGSVIPLQQTSEVLFDAEPCRENIGEDGIALFSTSRSDELPIVERLAIQYHVLCERFDRTVCDARNEHGEAVPRSQMERAMINRHADQAIRELLHEHPEVDAGVLRLQISSYGSRYTTEALELLAAKLGLT